MWQLPHAIISTFNYVQIKGDKDTRKLIKMAYEELAPFTRFSYLVRIGNEYGGHIEARAVERWSLTKLLHNLHHNPLPVRLVASLVCFRQVKSHPLTVFLAKGLNYI